MQRDTQNKQRQYFLLFLIIAALSALATSFIMVVLPNYLKEVYHVTALQRGFIELPRELPGVLAIFVIAILAGYSNITLSVVAQGLSIIGIAVLGFYKPSYGIMLFFIFINSMGHHLAMPINDSIGMALSTPSQIGKDMGRYKGVQTAFAMVASVIVFAGFKLGIFNFKSKWTTVFIVAAIVGIVSLILRIVLFNKVKAHSVNDKRVRFVFRKKYKNYYFLVILYGLQKQMMLVFSPWAIISIFGKGADTLAMLTIVGSFIGMFFIPKLGRWLDQFGIKKLLYLDAWSFVGVYLAFGLVISGVNHGFLTTSGIALTIVYAIFILDKMSNQMAMIRTLYLKKIAIHPSEVTPTLSLGLTLDHIVSITAAIFSGYIWTIFGAEYIFYIVAFVSLINVYIAYNVEQI